MKARGLEIYRPLLWAFYTTFSFLLISGIGWLSAYAFLREENDFSTIPSEYEALSLQLHGAFVPIFLVLLGWLIPSHIVRAIKANKNLLSGMIMIGVCLFLVFTGYLLYYSSNDWIRNTASLAHSIGGISIVGILVVHIMLGRRVRRKNNVRS